MVQTRRWLREEIDEPGDRGVDGSRPSSSRGSLRWGEQPHQDEFIEQLPRSAYALADPGGAGIHSEAAWVGRQQRKHLGPPRGQRANGDSAHHFKLMPGNTSAAVYPGQCAPEVSELLLGAERLFALNQFGFVLLASCVWIVDALPTNHSPPVRYKRSKAIDDVLLMWSL